MNEALCVRVRKIQDMKVLVLGLLATLVLAAAVMTVLAALQSAPHFAYDPKTLQGPTGSTKPPSSPSKSILFQNAG